MYYSINNIFLVLGILLSPTAFIKGYGALIYLSLYQMQTRQMKIDRENRIKEAEKLLLII